MAKSKKVENERFDKEKYQPVTMNQVLGDSGVRKYGTLDSDAYEKRVKEMNKAELQIHATKMGVIPRDNIPLMRRELVKEFKRYANQYQTPKPEQNKRGRKRKMDPKILSILKEAGATYV
jgi:hypothetical protein